jgi:hypothetical protein
MLSPQLISHLTFDVFLNGILSEFVLLVSLPEVYIQPTLISITVLLYPDTHR